jgi:uncharacterized membrane protein YhhN
MNETIRKFIPGNLNIYKEKSIILSILLTPLQGFRRLSPYKGICKELSVMNVFTIIFGVILLLGLLYYEKKKDRIPLLITKSTLSLLFVITALLQSHPVPTYYNYLLIGLIFCLIGDVCLALPQKKAFMAGLIAFLVGHLFYIFSFLSLTAASHWISTGVLIIFGASAFIFFWLRRYLGSMLLPVLLYILVITVMASGAWVVFRNSSFQMSGRTLILVGSLCFYVSDVFVARNKFIKEEYTNRLLGLPLYYTGQFLLAFSVGLLK